MTDNLGRQSASAPPSDRVFHDNRTWHAVGERCAGFWIDLTGKCDKSPKLPDPRGMAEILTRLEEAEAQRDRLRAALRRTAEDSHMWVPEDGHTRSVANGFLFCDHWRCRENRAALSDPTQEKP